MRHNMRPNSLEGTGSIGPVCYKVNAREGHVVQFFSVKPEEFSEFILTLWYGATENVPI